MKGLLRPVRLAAALFSAAVYFSPAGAAERSQSPYPPSPVIEAGEWAPRDEIIRLADGSDNWPNTWAEPWTAW